MLGLSVLDRHWILPVGVIGFEESLNLQDCKEIGIMALSDIIDLTVHGARDLLDRREVSSVELTQMALSRIEDVDIKKVADMAIAAKFRNNGQVCISPSLSLIHI